MAAFFGRGDRLDLAEQPLDQRLRHGESCTRAVRVVILRVSFQVNDRLQDIGFSVQGPKNEPVCEPGAADGAELLCEWLSGDPSDVRVMVTNRSASAVMLTFFHD